MRRFFDAAVKSLAVLAILSIALPSMAQDKKQKSLYERLGGLAPISVVVSDFIDEMVVDDELNSNPHIDEARKRVPAPYLKYHVTAMVCQATGGSCEYSGRSMDESHEHLKITEADWDRMVEILTGVLNKHKVPKAEQQELMAIVASTKEAIVMPGSKSE